MEESPVGGRSDRKGARLGRRCFEAIRQGSRPQLRPGRTVIRLEGGEMVRSIRSAMVLAAAGLAAVSAAVALGVTGSTGTLVSVGSPVAPFSQNKQNEPAVAIDANNPEVVVA